MQALWSMYDTRKYKASTAELSWRMVWHSGAIWHSASAWGLTDAIVREQVLTVAQALHKVRKEVGRSEENTGLQSLGV